MAEITSARIEPLAEGGDSPAGDSRQPIEKRKAPSKPAPPAPPPPQVEVDDHEEAHQLDELA